MDTPSIQEALESVIKQWNEAGSSWDTEKLSALFTHDALFFGSKQNLFVGDEVRQYYAAFPVTSCRFAFSDMQSVALGPSAIASCGTLSLAQTLSGGRKLDVRLRISLVIVMRGDVWKIIQHHVAPTKGFTAADLAPT